MFLTDIVLIAVVLSLSSGVSARLLNVRHPAPHLIGKHPVNPS
jgi:hypothetical protein